MPAILEDEQVRAPTRLICLTALLAACAAGEEIDASSTFFTQTTTTTTTTTMDTTMSTDTDPGNPETTGDGDGDDPSTTNMGDGDGEATGTPAVCGDGVKEGDEECDGNDLGGLSCIDFGFDDVTICQFVRIGFQFQYFRLQ